MFWMILLGDGFAEIVVDLYTVGKALLRRVWWYIFCVLNHVVRENITWNFFPKKSCLKKKFLKNFQNQF
jgi:hypothetical protein